jgi:hypothetical protein
MYSNDMTQIRTGLVNYIGAMAKATGFEGKAANQIVAAALIEEALKLSQVDGETCDLYVIKPLLRANIFILKQRCAQLAVLRSMAATEKARQYREIIQAYEDMTKDL